MASAGLWLLLVFETLLLPASPTGPAVNPNQLFQYAPNGTQVLVHLDLRSIKRQLEKSILDLKKQPFVTKEQTVQMMVEQMDRMLKKSIKRMEEREYRGLKIDNIRFITLALKFSTRMSKPDIIVTVRGKFSLKMLENFLSQGSTKFKREKMNGFVCFYALNRRKPSFAWTPTGQVLMATPKWLRALVKSGAQKAIPNSLKATVVKNYNPNHLFAVAVKMTNKMRRQMRRIPQIIRPLAMNLDRSYGAIWGGGSQVTLEASNQQIVEQYRLLLEGVGQFGVGSDYMRRGIVNIAEGVLSSKGQKENNRILDAIIKHKTAIFSYIRQSFTHKILQYKVTMKRKSATLRFAGNGGAIMPMLTLFGGFGYLNAVQSRRPSRIRYRSAPSKSSSPTARPSKP